MTTPEATALIHPNVVWGGDHTVGPFAIVGQPLAGGKVAETVIGPGALIRSHTVIYCGNRIGRNFQTGHGALVREENEIGDDVSIGSGTIVEHHVRIGDGARLHSNVFVPEFSVLEEGCWIGPNVVITNAKYPRSPGVKERLVGAHIERGAKIGANATLLPGVRIGRNALVGAGAVVTKDVAPESVVAGSPAREINRLSNLPYGESL
ncbi:MAG TPA: acyltransferase [Pyrinomonadaceae bacterium]|nr:acyltransferase [Pyrinomonadaceae bacterium]